MSAIAHVPVRSQPIQEDSTCFLALTCIPILGDFVAVEQLTSLAEQITHTTDKPRMIELLQVSKKYIQARIVKDCITIALIIVGFVVKAFASPVVPILAGGIIAYFAYKNIAVLKMQDQQIERLQRP